MKALAIILMGLSIGSGVFGVYWFAAALAWGSLSTWTLREEEAGNWVLVKE